MNTREAMQALLDGKKICIRYWDKELYIFMLDGYLVDTYGNNASLGNEGEWEIYKTKKTMYQFIYKESDGRVCMTFMLSEVPVMNCYKLLKVIEHEIEIEDE